LFIADPARLEHGSLRRDLACVEDLRPTVAEPAVAYDQASLAGGQLPRNRFHAKRPTARHHDSRVRVVDVLENARDVAHDALEALRHVIERAVRENDRVLE